MAFPQTETRPIGSFNGVSLDGVGTLNVNHGPDFTLTVVAEPEALPLITTEVENGALRIQTRLMTAKVLSLKHPPVYTITAPTLTEVALRGAGRATVGSGVSGDLMVHVDGAGDVHLNEQNLRRLRVRISGAGHVKGKGTATIQDIEIAGTGNFSGAKLEGEAVSVLIPGAGLAKVNASRVLEITIGGIGQVTYKGDPQVRQNVAGLGRVTRA